jgi:3-phenylpropionate/trans-cinnamate dioxygenase ferredoxin reductase subunit
MAGRLGDEEVLLVRDGDRVYAIGASCSHYHGPLAEGIVVDGTIRCPWHHACFDLKSGAVLRAPAPSALPVWKVEQGADRFFIREKLVPPVPPRSERPESVVIVGAGAAGVNAADTLRSEGYAGRIVLVSREPHLPYDKPNLSKDYLAGAAPPEWLPLHPREYYEQQQIDLRLGENVTAVDTKAGTVATSSGDRIAYGALVLATGAAPKTLPGRTGVHYLRTREDAERLVERAANARRAVVIGSSFIGLEVAASLRQRGLAVTVSAPDRVPLERVLGIEVGERIRAIHEDRGVVFRLGEPGFDDALLREADLIVAGIGVSPEVELARSAGLATADGILVDEYLQTSAPGVWACGDVASWPGATGGRLRVEHWVVAGRQGQTVARNILGQRRPFDAVPFFWSAHYDVVISYVGHGSGSDAIEIDGSLAANDATIFYRREDRLRAVATIGRDLVSLQSEVAMERATSSPRPPTELARPG